jgi:hypothetical protein
MLNTNEVDAEYRGLLGCKAGHSTHESLSLQPALTGCLLGLIFEEGGGDILLRNITLPSELHGVTSHKTVLFIFTTMRSLNPKRTGQVS